MSETQSFDTLQSELKGQKEIKNYIEAEIQAGRWPKESIVHWMPFQDGSECKYCTSHFHLDKMEIAWRDPRANGGAFTGQSTEMHFIA